MSWLGVCTSCGGKAEVRCLDGKFRVSCDSGAPTYFVSSVREGTERGLRAEHVGVVGSALL